MLRELYKGYQGIYPDTVEQTAVFQSVLDQVTKIVVEEGVLVVFGYDRTDTFYGPYEVEDIIRQELHLFSRSEVEEEILWKIELEGIERKEETFYGCRGIQK